jgi:ABC-type branched-subunit amino acid transport system permease subunit
MIMIIAVIMVIGAVKLIKTRVGRAFIAIRDSDIAAEAMGVNLTYYKTLSFAVSAFYTGIGWPFAFILGFINPGASISSCRSLSWRWWLWEDSDRLWAPSPEPYS